MQTTGVMVFMVREMSTAAMIGTAHAAGAEEAGAAAAATAAVEASPQDMWSERGWPQKSLSDAQLAALLAAPTAAVETSTRQQAVVTSFRWAWAGYKRSAWGWDEVMPVSMKPNKWFGLGLTIVDCLDTMLLMGLKEEYTMARKWVAEDLDLTQDTDVNLFETTIRVLGGLLSAFHLSGNDPLYRDKAVQLAERLLPAFQSPSGVPFSDVNLGTGKAHPPKWTEQVPPYTPGTLIAKQCTWRFSVGKRIVL
jgi:hypothetical protein